MSDLVERLRSEVTIGSGTVTPIRREAALEIERLRHMVRQMRGMADRGTIAPNAAYRWCERIEEVAQLGPQDEYEEWAWSK